MYRNRALKNASIFACRRALSAQLGTSAALGLSRLSGSTTGLEAF
jgi:hypothetical protein